MQLCHVNATLMSLPEIKFIYADIALLSVYLHRPMWSVPKNAERK